MKSKILMLFMVLAGIGLSGCAMLTGQNKDAERCPETGFLKHADIIRYNNETYLLDVNMYNLTGGCEITEDGLALDVNLNFAANWTDRGMDSPRRVKIPYFATILDKDDEILSKTEFAAILSMSDNRGTASENVTLRIPMDSPAYAGRHRVIFGFPVTPAQYHENQLNHYGESLE